MISTVTPCKYKMQSSTWEQCSCFAAEQFGDAVPAVLGEKKREHKTKLQTITHCVILYFLWMFAFIWQWQMKSQGEKEGYDMQQRLESNQRQLWPFGYQGTPFLF